MKRRHWLIMFVLPILLLVVAGGSWLWRAKRQYMLNRQLIVALEQNDSQQAIALVNMGADPNTRYTPSPAPTLKLLLDQLLHHPSTTDDDTTAFLMACGSRWEPPQDLPETGFAYRKSVIYPENLPLVLTMLAHGANLYTQDRDHQSALRNAVMRNYLRVAQLLLEHKADVNERDSSGITPLMWAAMLPDATMTRLLLDHGAKVSVEDEWGQSALHWAMKPATNRDMLRLLLTHGADPN